MTAVVSTHLLNPLNVRQQLSLSQERLAQLLGVSVKTVSRWEREARQPTDSNPLERLAKLKEVAELGRMVYTENGLKEFLKTPLPVFGGRSALDLLQLGDYQPVLGALAADFEGSSA
ncbi:helix-turn-helix domain-containing protein [Merismopedia glauca]|uniref:Transcriptional regulator n=1 Tax=Merismopedia glauca CCAP 1448/3 TaxID=1296344 RepID=A0A2T1C0G4_9CYAN|nr:helix-turn-helix transcriptional regulator [Merismopedia glauca]PSB01732.1 transcriptional regulator [Merismopedia glauca CCAP 1448/3]